MTQPYGNAVIYGCSGPELTVEEAIFFRSADPLGFILFQRNCVSPPQISALTMQLRECIGRADAPILIDQEGGRVQRLKPPQWRAAPPARIFGELATHDLEAGRRAAWINARLIAAELAPLGITVDCAPVLDHPVEGAHDIIGDRAFSEQIAIIAGLGRATADGLRAGGVLPVIKHIPGHGRATVDSHLHCPVVETGAALMEITDLPPFAALADQPFAMTAHVVYTAWDAENVATMSPLVIDTIIRRQIGFRGVLLSDDLSMNALGGPIHARATQALAAGCDVVLHCNGHMGEMEEIASVAGPLKDASLARVVDALAKQIAALPADLLMLRRELDALLRSGQNS